MIDYQPLQLAVRAELDAIVVATTGQIDLSATNKVFSRSTGSFLTDGFHPGMEITGSNLGVSANEDPSIAREVLAQGLTVDRTLTTEASGSNKTLLAYLPSQRAYENEEFNPEQGHPYLEERLVPATNTQITVGPGGTVEAFPLYVATVHVPNNVGIGAHNAYVKAILSRFKPRYAFSLSDGNSAAVRTNPAPFRSQALPSTDGWTAVAVTIPLRLYTINP